jgi:hypothetical protein
MLHLQIFVPTNRAFVGVVDNATNSILWPSEISSYLLIIVPIWVVATSGQLSIWRFVKVCLHITYQQILPIQGIFERFTTTST